jgi:hypothetical protein
MNFIKIREFWTKNEQKIVLVVAFCLVSGISFEFGLLQGQKWQQKPLMIEKQADTAQEGLVAQNEPSGGLQTPSKAQISLAGATPTNMAGCAFVGSKNSTKFYVPSCSFAKRIKPENLACYTSEADAISKGKVKSDCK